MNRHVQRVALITALGVGVGLGAACRSASDREVRPYPTEELPTQPTPPEQRPPGTPPRPDVYIPEPDAGTEVPVFPGTPDAPPDRDADADGGRGGETIRRE